MDKTQWAYEQGYQTALRSLAAKEETTDYSVQQANMMLDAVREDFDKLVPLIQQALKISNDMDAHYQKIREVIANAPNSDDRASAANVFWSNMWDAIGHPMSTFGGESIFTTRLKELVEDDVDKVDSGLTKIGH